MKVQSQEIVWIGMGKLIAHPKNANVMSKEMMGKLRRHIEGSGRYEPLVVRRHPEREGCYEMINGHHRKKVLEKIGEREAACVVWELSDVEALMLLATVNRLEGEDAAGKRVDLLETLSKEIEMAAEELAKWLPEDEGVLKGLLEREEVEVEEPPEIGEMEEAFTVFLKSGEKRRLVEGLRKVDRDLGRALMVWVGRFGEKRET